jgi:hypothetical protein
MSNGSGRNPDAAGRTGRDEDASPEHADDMEPMSFDIFVLSLNASALIHLGEAGDAPGVMTINLPLARQTIDILGMLEAKTRGNLSGEEERLLHDILFDLRMRFARHADRPRK